MHGLVTINYTNLFFFSDFLGHVFGWSYTAKTIFSLIILYFDDIGGVLLLLCFKDDRFLMEITWEVAMIWLLQRFCQRWNESSSSFPISYHLTFAHFTLATQVSSPILVCTENSYHRKQVEIPELHSLKLYLIQKYSAEDLGDKEEEGEWWTKEEIYYYIKKISPPQLKKWWDQMFDWSGLMNLQVLVEDNLVMILLKQ